MSLSHLTDEQFLAGFDACALPPSAFDHRGHLRIAWILLQRYPYEEAVECTCGGIRAFANHLGVPGKYHRTLTEALVRLMAAGGASRLGWGAFLAANPALVSDARGVLARHYSDACLAREVARTAFVPPDRAPLPEENAWHHTTQ